MTDEAMPPLSPEEKHHLRSVLERLPPMGGHTLYDEAGRADISVCGNVPPYVPGIRLALEMATSPSSTRDRPGSTATAAVSSGKRLRWSTPLRLSSRTVRPSL
jgi:hypothetical protein